MRPEDPILPGTMDVKLDRNCDGAAVRVHDGYWVCGLREIIICTCKGGARWLPRQASQLQVVQVNRDALAKPMTT